MMNDDPVRYDIFISYARDELDWVREHLYEPLLHCRTTDGHRPRIFFDVGELGIGIGENWMAALAQAIKVCHKFVPVYSARYFVKPICQWELQQAFIRDPLGRSRIFNPILKEPSAAGLVPPEVSLINYRTIASADWFEQLCLALNVERVSEHLKIKFLDEPPAQVTINHILSPLRVALTAEDQPVKHEGEVTLRATAGQLQGSLTAPLQDGIAIFEDLSFAEPVKETQFFANADGCEGASGQGFEVIAPAVVAPPVAVPIILLPNEAGNVWAMFFADGQSLAVFSSEQVAVYDSTVGSSFSLKGTLPLKGPVRFWRRGGQVIALADWHGRVYTLWGDGRSATWDFTDSATGFVVPGDISFADDRVYVGMWNGMIYRLTYGEKSVPVLRHAGGVQALAYASGRFYVCGFDGMVHVYEHARRVNGSNLVDRSIHLLQACGNVLVAVGEEKLYQIQIRPFEIISEPLPLTNVLAVFGDVLHPMVTDAKGKGIFFDSDLTIQASFSTVPGALPISIDNVHYWRVFYNPDGAFSLMDPTHVVFDNRSGLVAVAPSGDMFAVGDPTGIRLLNKTQMRSLF